MNDETCRGSRAGSVTNFDDLTIVNALTPLSHVSVASTISLLVGPGLASMRINTTEFVPVAVSMVACAGAVMSAFYGFSNRNRELDIELIKIGISILRADPKETQTSGAREWAIQVIETYSRHPFSPAAKRELLQGKLNIDPYSLWDGGDYIGGRKSSKPVGDRYPQPSK